MFDLFVVFRELPKKKSVPGGTLVNDPPVGTLVHCAPCVGGTIS